MLSDYDLCYFLKKIKDILDFFKSGIEDIEFINLSGFYAFVYDIEEHRAGALKELVNIVEPYIPLVISRDNLVSLVISYEEGDMVTLQSLEQEYAIRSKLIFINSVIKAHEEDWDDIVLICRKIRDAKIESLTLI